MRDALIALRDELRAQYSMWANGSTQSKLAQWANSIDALLAAHPADGSDARTPEWRETASNLPGARRQDVIGPAKAPSLREWQSIESAPKDGTRILVLAGPHPLMRSAKPRVSIARWGSVNDSDDGWVRDNIGVFGEPVLLWMPLPGLDAAAALPGEPQVQPGSQALMDQWADGFQHGQTSAASVSARLLAALKEQTTRACQFNCDVASWCMCPAHEAYRAAIREVRMAANDRAEVQTQEVISACASYLERNYGDDAAEYVAALREQAWGRILPLRQDRAERALP